MRIVMKICVLGPSKQFHSGLTVHTILLSNALVQKNEVSVVLLRNLLPKFLYPGRNHVGKSTPIVDFKSDVDVFEGMDWNSPLSWFRALKFLKTQNPDAIVMLWWSSAVVHMQLFIALANKIGIKAKIILEMHEVIDPMEDSILPIRLYSRIAGRVLMKNADAFTVHSETVKNQVVQVYNVSEDKVFVKPFGLYHEYNSDCDKGTAKDELKIDEEYVILCFGSIRKYKGVSQLVKAFSLLPEHIAESSRLIIAGESWGDDDELYESINKSSYKGQITLHDYFIPDDMIPVYFSACDVVVLPYIRTSGSGVANVAMTHGKSIITSDLEVMRELLADYNGSAFVQPGDPESIKEQLVCNYDNKKAGANMSFEHPENTWDSIETQYRQIINDLL